MADTSTNAWQGAQRPWTNAAGLNEVDFIVRQILAGIATAHLVQITAVTNEGGLEPVGYVDAQLLVNQVNGFAQATPRGVISNLPYMRIQGGANAVILDPQVGDIGMAVFASRDISGVKSARKAANPSSSRAFSLSDGLYVGGFLNGVPTQYIRFAADGIEVVSPTKVRIVAPTIEAEGDMTLTGSLHITEGLTVDQTAAITGKLTAAEGDIGGTGTQPVKLSDDSPATKLKAK